MTMPAFTTPFVTPIDFIDLQAQRKRIAPEIDAAVLEVIHSGKFIMGPQVKQLEQDLQAFSHTPYVVGCGSGTEALMMPLMARDIGPGHAVFLPAFTFPATAEVVALLGASPVFVDVLPDTFNMDPASLAQAIEQVKKEGTLQPKAVIGVDLYGLPSCYEALEALAKANDMFLMVDSAQGYGATYQGKATVNWGDVAATSFFPAKPLGCYGDGGAIFTHDETLYHKLLSIRVHGQGAHRYDIVRLGINGRLDTIQAAVLIEKLKIYTDEITRRQKIAARYTAGLQDVITTPSVPQDCTSVWAQYTVRTENRDALAAFLHEKGVPTMVYYPIPLPQQKAYHHYPLVEGGVPVSEKLAQTVLSLPMHPYLSEKVQDYIIETIKSAC